MDEKIVKNIIELKEKNNAVLLAHNYQIPEIQDIADFVGDSLDLSLKATKTDADVIVFCGVSFMAEAAKILNPEKTVIHPDRKAGCPLADMVDVESLNWLQKDHPDAKTVAYINTSANVKAVSDVCCTSANAIKVIEALDSEKIIFVPDFNLGSYVKRFIKDKELIIWPGICPTHHNRIEKEDIIKLKNLHPDAEIMVHPECKPEVIDIADHVLSTNGMVKRAKESSSKEFIVGTEKELCYRLKKENPDKEFYPIEKAVCPNMKKINLNKVLNSLKNLKPVVELPEDIMERARLPLERMISMGRSD